ncbi:hypothetical protein BN129_4027 [Cronobacter sakazakii 701]|nr:hypothetical protein BN129_4027 [Cronobacter sakazakii 701]
MNSLTSDDATTASGTKTNRQISTTVKSEAMLLRPFIMWQSLRFIG